MFLLFLFLLLLFSYFKAPSAFYIITFIFYISTFKWRELHYNFIIKQETVAAIIKFSTYIGAKSILSNYKYPWLKANDIWFSFRSGINDFSFFNMYFRTNLCIYKIIYNYMVNLSKFLQTNSKNQSHLKSF
mgnify:FL=1